MILVSDLQNCAFKTLHKNLSFTLKISPANVTNPQLSTDLVTFTEEILNGKLHFSSSETSKINIFLVILLKL